MPVALVKSSCGFLVRLSPLVLYKLVQANVNTLLEREETDESNIRRHWQCPFGSLYLRSKPGRDILQNAERRTAHFTPSTVSLGLSKRTILFKSNHFSLRRTAHFTH